LYRIEDRQALETLGLDDIFNERAIIIVEWPDRLNLPAKWPILNIKLEHVSEEVRKITIDNN
jgi:tRNA A37 threonylcarbamoyladenosine biosynthesis protein TsaE